jgi:predicted transcriptional regulator
MKRIVIEIDEDRKRMLKNLAFEKNTTIRSIIIEAIDDIIKKDKVSC